LDQALAKKPKHVIQMVFDGMGTSSLKQHLAVDSFLRDHLVEEIQSVFPPTTTAAMTSYYTGISPGEHGWLGWSLHFRDYDAIVDVFTNVESYTGKPMPTKKIGYHELPFKSIYEKIKEVQGEAVEIHTMMPESIDFISGANNHHPIKDLDHQVNELKKVTDQDRPSYTMAYWPNPDALMHQKGPEDQSVLQCLRQIDAHVAKVAEQAEDTLIIVSADHGQIGIREEIELHLDESLNSMLVMPPSIEPRCVSFFVNGQRMAEFKESFEERYSGKFLLLTHEEIVKKQFFGYGPYHEKFDDFVGDYIAIGTTHSIIQYKTVGGRDPIHFKGHHGGLTDEEMSIPLILIERG